MGLFSFFVAIGVALSGLAQEGTASLPTIPARLAGRFA
jgi:hypothetical protein